MASLTFCSETFLEKLSPLNALRNNLQWRSIRKTKSCKKTPESPDCSSSLTGQEKIRSRQFKRFWNWFGKSKCPGSLLKLIVNFDLEHSIVPTSCPYNSEDSLKETLLMRVQLLCYCMTFAPRKTLPSESRKNIFTCLKNRQNCLDKRLGTLLRFWDVFQCIQVQPLPSPYKQCWTGVSKIFSEVQLCIGWGGEGWENCKKISKRMHCFKRELRTEKYEYCSTVRRTFIQDCRAVFHFSVKCVNSPSVDLSFMNPH